MTTNRSMIVQKYGGSSLATPDHIQRVARHVMKRKESGCDLLVVVSAMGKTTDNLVKLAHEVNPNPTGRELDMLLASGEQISISALALAINSNPQFHAVSFTGPQAGIFTDAHHTKARIQSINTRRLREALDADRIVIVAGFQGMTESGELTTLGRGGSDTTAVALAAALDADYCEIMSDIDGIYSADPKRVPTAKRIDRIHYDQALEMAACGAKMLHKTSVEFAKRHLINLSLGSSLSGEIGTVVSGDALGKGGVSAVAGDEDVCIIRFALNEVEALHLPELFSKQNIHLKLWQSVQGLGMAGVSRGDLNLAVRLLSEKTTNVSVEEDWALLSIIGEAVGVGTIISQRFFEILTTLNMQYGAVISDDLFLKVLCPRARINVALQRLHTEFIDTESG